MGFVKLGKLSEEALQRLLRSRNDDERKPRIALVRSDAGSGRIDREAVAAGAAQAREKANRAKIV